MKRRPQTKINGSSPVNIQIDERLEVLIYEWVSHAKLTIGWGRFESQLDLDCI